MYGAVKYYQNNERRQLQSSDKLIEESFQRHLRRSRSNLFQNTQYAFISLDNNNTCNVLIVMSRICIAIILWDGEH